LPGWQKVYDQYKDQGFELLSVAVDVQGEEVVRPYAENHTFTTVVDSDNLLADTFGFKIVPNGIFIDENGILRLVKQGFSVSKPDHLEAVEQLIRGEVQEVTLDDEYHVTEAQSTVETQLAETKFKLAKEYLKQQKKDEALKELDDALLLDPENFLIRKQRWYIRYPEKFSPTIDIDWQQEQLKKEKEQEQAICGPEGCVIPGTNTKPDSSK
jgi:tetratricopeptide (TPR) repeat protein